MFCKAYSKNEIKIDKAEMLRYACSKNADTDDLYSSVFDDAVKAAINLAEPKVIYEFFPISVRNDTVNFPDFSVKSKNLSKNMHASDMGIIFAATLGIKSERELIKRKTDSTSLVFINAAFTAILEDIINRTFLELREMLAKENRFLRPRFSPGYGDFELLFQKDIFRALDLERRMGMALTENLFMIPSKSVTAVCAVSKTNQMCQLSGCEACNKKNSCQFCRI